MKKTFIAIALVVVIAIVAGPASAGGRGGKGKPSGGTSSSLSLVLMNGATQAQRGGSVTFNVATTATDRPFVGLRCYQGPDWVYDAYVGYFDGAMFDSFFTLDSPYWRTGEAASCTARLFWYDRRGNQNVLTTLDFPVAA
jgi:hypothetical protein